MITNLSGGPSGKKKKLERPDVNIVTLEWIDEHRQRYNISDYELSLQTGQQSSYLGQIRLGKMNFSRAAKAAVWQFFYRLKREQSIE